MSYANWSPTVYYAVDDIVFYNGSTYIAVGDTINVPPFGSGDWNIIDTVSVSGSANAPADSVGEVKFVIKNVSPYITSNSSVVASLMYSDPPKIKLTTITTDAADGGTISFEFDSEIGSQQLKVAYSVVRY